MRELLHINPELEREIIELTEEGNIYHQSNLYTIAIDSYQDAWNKLPDDKQWDYLTYWIAGCLFQAYFDIQEYKTAKEWIKLSMAGQTSKIDTGGFIDLGIVCYELNQLEESYLAFDCAFKIGNKHPFKDHDRKYLTFYLDKKEKTKSHT